MKPYHLLHNLYHAKGFTAGLMNCCAIQLCWETSYYWWVFTSKYTTNRELTIWIGHLQIRLIAWKRMRRDTCYQNGSLMRLVYKSGSNFVWDYVPDSERKFYEPVWIGSLENGGIRG